MHHREAVLIAVMIASAPGSGWASQEIQATAAFAVARDPSEKETKRLEQLLDEFVPGPEDAKLKLPANLPKDTDPASYAAWVTVSRVLLNLDELITRE